MSNMKFLRFARSQLFSLARKFKYETFFGNFQTLWIIRHKNNHQRWIAWKPKRQVTSVTVTPHSTLGLNFNPSTSFNPSPKLEFNPNPTENSISTENSVEENLNSITTESFQNLKKKEFESSTLFEILNMTANLDDPNDQFAINNDDVFLLNEEEEDELSLQTEEK